MTRIQATAFVLLPMAIALAQQSVTVVQNDRAALYAANCATCHGEDGAGKTAAGQKLKLANLRSDTVQKQSYKELFNSIANGLRHKQYPHAFAHRGLTTSQVEELVAHIRELAKTKK